MNDRQTQLAEQIDRAVAIIEVGGIVILPADTVYGIFGSVASESAIERVYAIKGRKRGKPFGVVSNQRRITEVVKLSSSSRKLIEQCWPSAMSVIAPKNMDSIPEYFSGDEAGLLVVCAENEILSAIVDRCSTPIFSTTCNFSGEPEAKTVEELAPLARLVDFVIENHSFQFKGKPSTIVNIMGEMPVLVREGAVPIADIQRVLPDIEKNGAMLIQ